MRILRYSIAIALCTSSIAEERRVAEFDASKATVRQLSQVIRKEVSNGATVVVFREGRWKWHNLGRLGLPKIERKATKAFDYTAGLEKDVRRWTTENEVKAVQIALDPELPAKAFFSVERILTRLEIPYALTHGPGIE